MKYYDMEILEKIPEGWKEYKNSTSPVGCAWFSNGEKVFIEENGKTKYNPKHDYALVFTDKNEFLRFYEGHMLRQMQNSVPTKDQTIIVRNQNDLDVISDDFDGEIVLRNAGTEKEPVIIKKAYANPVKIKGYSYVIALNDSTVSVFDKSVVKLNDNAEIILDNRN